MKPFFVKDTNTYGPYVNGHTFETGLLWGTDPQWEDVESESGIIRQRPVGIFATAERVNGQIRQTGDWQDNR